MQTLKDDIRQQIIVVARTEFIAKGFKGASMRSIAKKSEVTLSNIYNYFRNKDEIFYEVLKPLLKALDKLLEEHNNEDYLTVDVFTIRTLQYRMIDDFLMSILKNYRHELKLLLFNASGSSLENFRDAFIDKQTETGMTYLALMKKKYPDINANISTFFIHNVCSWWLTVIQEIVSHEELTEKDVQTFLYEYISFSTAGWKKLMNV